MLSSCKQKFLIFFSFCIFSNTAPTFYCQDWNTKQIFTLFWVSCSNDVHERASLKIFLCLCTGCLTLVWMFLNGSFITEKFWFCWIFHVCHRNSCELIHKKIENREITMAPLILRLISWKSLPHSIKIFVKLDFV